MAPIDDSVMRHQAWLGQLLNNDRNAADSTCDLVLESGGKQFKVHKSVLMLVSNYFRRMFTIEMKEKYEGIVKMQKIPHQRLANIIQFIYSGEIEITEENMLDVLDDAEYTEIKVVKTKCSAFLLDVVSPKNCLRLRAYAQRYNLDDLLNKTEHMMAQSFEAVIQNEDFKHLEYDDVCYILDNRNKGCEEAVFTGIVQWVNHNPLQREDLFVKLFSKLDLTVMFVDFLDEVYEENLVKTNVVCLNLLAHAALKMNKKHCGAIQSKEFILVGGEDTERDCVIYDVTTKQARLLPELQKPRCNTTSVKVGSEVYVIGGAKTVGDKPHKSCEMLNLNEQSRWNAIPDMRIARLNCGSEVMEEYIYVTGGCNERPTSSCEKYDIHKKRWFRIKDMLHERESHGTAVYHDSLYCIGGWDGKQRLSSCECFNAINDTWNEIAPLNRARDNLASVLLGGNIYAIGGSIGDRSVNTVEKYDPNTNKWEIVASLCVARSKPSACVVGNKIYVIGGWDDTNNLKSVEVYNQTSDVWSIAFKMQIPVYAAAAVAI